MRSILPPLQLWTSTVQMQNVMQRERFEDYSSAVQFLCASLKNIVRILYHALTLGLVFLKKAQFLVVRQIGVMQHSNFGHLNLLFSEGRIGCRG